MKKLTLILLVLCSSSRLFSQGTNPAYDSILAKKLHADKNGLKKYVMVILKTGPGDTVKGWRRDTLFAGHMRNINKLAESQKLVVAGPLLKNNLSYRGIFILNCETLEEAKALCASDPTVKAEVFNLELLYWYATAALQETTRIHKKLVKDK